MAIHTKFCDFCVYFVDRHKLKFIVIKGRTCLNEDGDIGQDLAKEKTLISLWCLKMNFYQNWVISCPSYLRPDRQTKWRKYKLLPRVTCIKIVKQKNHASELEFLSVDCNIVVEAQVLCASVSSRTGTFEYQPQTLYRAGSRFPTEQSQVPPLANWLNWIGVRTAMERLIWRVLCCLRS